MLELLENHFVNKILFSIILPTPTRAPASGTGIIIRALRHGSPNEKQLEGVAWWDLLCEALTTSGRDVLEVCLSLCHAFFLILPRAHVVIIMFKNKILLHFIFVFFVGDRRPKLYFLQIQITSYSTVTHP